MSSARRLARIRRYATHFRRHPTPAEAQVLTQVRASYPDLVVHPQVPIYPFIVDLLLSDYGIIVEIDGDSHDTPHQKQYDRNRTRYLRHFGFEVMRVTHHDVFSRGRQAVKNIGLVVAHTKRIAHTTSWVELVEHMNSDPERAWKVYKSVRLRRDTTWLFPWELRALRRLRHVDPLYAGRPVKWSRKPRTSWAPRVRGAVPGGREVRVMGGATTPNVGMGLTVGGAKFLQEYLGRIPQHQPLQAAAKRALARTDHLNEIA